MGWKDEQLRNAKIQELAEKRGYRIAQSRSTRLWWLDWPETLEVPEGWMMTSFLHTASFEDVIKPRFNASDYDTVVMEYVDESGHIPEREIPRLASTIRALQEAIDQRRPPIDEFNARFWGLLMVWMYETGLAIVEEDGHLENNDRLFSFIEDVHRTWNDLRGNPPEQPGTYTPGEGMKLADLLDTYGSISETAKLQLGPATHFYCWREPYLWTIQVLEQKRRLRAVLLDDALLGRRLVDEEEMAEYLRTGERTPRLSSFAQMSTENQQLWAVWRALENGTDGLTEAWGRASWLIQAHGGDSASGEAIRKRIAPLLRDAASELEPGEHLRPRRALEIATSLVYERGLQAIEMVKLNKLE